VRLEISAQGNVMIIVISSFSKCFLVKMFSVLHSNCQPLCERSELWATGRDRKSSLGSKKCHVSNFICTNRGKYYSTTTGTFDGVCDWTFGAADWDKQEEYKELVHEDLDLPIQKYLAFANSSGLKIVSKSSKTPWQRLCDFLSLHCWSRHQLGW